MGPAFPLAIWTPVNASRRQRRCVATRDGYLQKVCLPSRGIFDTCSLHHSIPDGQQRLSAMKASPSLKPSIFSVVQNLS
ncbi:hypothetical protein CB0940_07768 [Cercospora beticola]|uniref:Uncharacterized protein n=1 Tax=Cercospora beticola TaxID=122368 RepID=A0A2G5HAT3_CERBT|nr:hypothetical protein CB0940_07768 [Cercospora beticola]PIA89342.1 hypothetical protein CB0940_07768 [Cercospora beticola]